MGTIQGASLVVFTSSENEATKAESLPSFVQLLPSRGFAEKRNTRKSAGKIRPGAGGKGFLLIVLKLSCIFQELQVESTTCLCKDSRAFSASRCRSGLTRSFRASRWSSGSSICPAAFHKRDNPHPVSRNDRMTNKTHSECRMLAFDHRTNVAGKTSFKRIEIFNAWTFSPFQKIGISTVSTAPA